MGPSGEHSLSTRSACDDGGRLAPSWVEHRACGGLINRRSRFVPDSSDGGRQEDSNSSRRLPRRIGEVGPGSICPTPSKALDRAFESARNRHRPNSALSNAAGLGLQRMLSPALGIRCRAGVSSTGISCTADAGRILCSRAFCGNACKVRPPRWCRLLARQRLQSGTICLH